MFSYIEDMVQLASQGEAQGVMFWAAVYMFVVCLYSIVRQKQTNAWPCVPGKLLKIGVNTFGSSPTKVGQDYVANALYEYQVDGKQYTGSTISAWGVVASHNMRFVLSLQSKAVKTLPGGRVCVYYNPKNPKKSLLIRPGWKSQLITAMLGLALPAWYWSTYMT